MGKIDVMLLILVGLVLACFLSTVHFFSHVVTNPNCCVEDFPSRRTNPAWQELKTPIDVGVSEYHDVEIPTLAGDKIKAWIVPPRIPEHFKNKSQSKPSQKFIILVHDSGADKRQMLDLAAQINKRIGWGSLLFDTRETEVSQFGRGAVTDVSDALRYVRSKEHASLEPIRKVAVLGVAVGGGAGMWASIKDPSVDAFISVSMPSTAYQYWQAALHDAVEELKVSVPSRLAKNETVEPQARLAHFVTDLVVKDVVTQVRDESSEASNYMAKMAEMSKGWFIDISAHLTVMYGAGYRAWLQEIADPHKAIHRLQPRAYYLVHGKEDTITPMWLAQVLYNRAGACSPKVAHISNEQAHVLDLRDEDEFYKKLRTIM